MKNVLDREISYFSSKADKAPTRRNLLEVLLSDEQVISVQKGQAIIQQHGEAAYKLYKEKQPCFLVSVTCEGGHGADCITDHTGLFGFDIDGLGGEKNPDWTPAEVKECLAYCTNVAYCGVSFGQNGVWGIVPVEEPTRHTQYFDALKAIFINIGNWWKDKPLVIDKSCGNLNRLRFHAFDPNPTLRYDAESLMAYELPTPVAPARPLIQTYEWNSSESILLNRCVRLVIEAQDGEKHYRLNKAAFMAGGFIAGGLVDERTAVTALEDAISQKSNVANLRAAIRTIQEGIRDGKQQPIYQEPSVSSLEVPTTLTSTAGFALGAISIGKSTEKSEMGQAYQLTRSIGSANSYPATKTHDYFQWQKTQPPFNQLGIASLTNNQAC